MEAMWPAWSGYILRAWETLRDDRFFGSMGGMGRIHYSAISQYAKDHSIKLYPFVTYIQALDGVWMEYCAEKAEQENQE